MEWTTHDSPASNTRIEIPHSESPPAGKANRSR
jgi:hypothetical protein